MATVDELLSFSDELDETLVIDNDLRTIIVPDSVKHLGVMSDDDVLRLKFRMPRQYREIDLSKFAIRINYLNAQKAGDVYKISDKQVEDEYITFSWLVGRFALAISGNVIFNVCLKLIEGTGEDAVVAKEFNTKPSTLPVLEGLETIEQVIQAYPDIVQVWEEEIVGRFRGNIDDTLTISGQAADAAVTGARLSDLETTVARRTDISTPYNFKGTTVHASLPMSDNKVNDTYYCTDRQCKYTWNGSAWYQSSFSEADYANELALISARMATKNGNQEISNSNLQLVEAINPNFFDVRTAPYHSIYGYATPENNNIVFLDQNTVRFDYNGGMQFSFEIDNSTYDQIYYRIESDNKLDWVRFSSAKNLTTGSTILTGGTHAEGTYNIGVNHFLVFFAPANTTISIYINAGNQPTVYKVRQEHLPPVCDYGEMSMMALGDSITVNCTGWHSVVKDGLGLEKFSYIGKGGLTITDIGAENRFESYVTPDFANYDVIFVMGGTNDFGQSVPLGDTVYTNGFKTTTFKGAVADLIVKIQSMAPNAKIVMATPLSGRGPSDGSNATSLVKNSLGLTTLDYAKAMIEVCEEFSIPYIDIYGLTGINQFNRSKYIEDSVHPNTEGQTLIGKTIINHFNVAPKGIQGNTGPVGGRGPQGEPGDPTLITPEYLGTVRVYTGLDQLGLTVADVTSIDKIWDKMAVPSMLVLSGAALSGTTGIMPVTNGVLEILRPGTQRIIARCTESSVGDRAIRSWFGAFTVKNDGTRFSGWQQYADRDFVYDELENAFQEGVNSV